MKAIMLSIKPKWVAKILNGEKTIEIRKTMPKCDLPIDVYIYCSKGNSTTINMETLLFGNPTNAVRNGKVVAKFTLRTVDKISYYKTFDYPDGYEDFDGVWHDRTITYNDVHYISHGDRKKSCLTYDELQNYLGKKDGYAWHIEDLVIFNKPKQLTWFRGTTIDYDFVGKPYHPFIKKAPQSYCYIEVE